MRSLPIIVLTIMIFGVTLVYAAPCGETKFNSDGSIIVCPDNPDMAADYKLQYAMTYSQDELVKSKIVITDYDITYITKLINSYRESCAAKGGISCTDAKDYQIALDKLKNAMAQQTGNPPESTPTSSPETGEKKKSGAWSQLSNWAKWLNDLTNTIIRALKGFI